MTTRARFFVGKRATIQSRRGDYVASSSIRATPHPGVGVLTESSQCGVHDIVTSVDQLGSTLQIASTSVRRFSREHGDGRPLIRPF